MENFDAGSDGSLVPVSGRVRVTLALCALASVTWSCTLPAQSCDCTDGNIYVNVPLAQAAPTNIVALSGSACAGVAPVCLQTVGASCLQFAITPVAAGPCEIDVFLPGHEFAARVTVKRQTGCCSGLFPDPSGAGSIDVTSGRFRLTAQ